MKSINQYISNAERLSSIDDYIIEKFKLSSKNLGSIYHPKTKEELEELVKKLIKERGNDADLNDIDVSNIEDMSQLFYGSSFNGDISQWDVSNVKNMTKLFSLSKFNGDISEWDVSNVENMYKMFTRSKFSRDISKWNVDKVKKNFAMFRFCPLEKNPPKWYKIL